MSYPVFLGESALPEMAGRNLIFHTGGLGGSFFSFFSFQFALLFLLKPRFL